MNKVIFGGGFDPIHLGHINMALMARDLLNADIIFVPAKVAIWKKESLDSFHKLEMLKLAIKDHERFFIDTYELEQEEQPYSFQTINYFKKKCPKDRLYLLIGQDQVNSFHLWKKAEEIADLVQIVYFKRPKLEINLENVNRYKMKELDGEEIDVSSTDIRDLKSVLVPEAVLKYIEDNNLYFINKIRPLIKESRYYHSLSVAHLAYKIAKKHNLDYSKAYIAGILHDIAKGINDGDSLKLMKQFYPDDVDIGAFCYHQFLGEKLAKEEFKVVDEEILGAIKYHTTGKANMNWLEKLIYASDKVDPLRGYDSNPLINALMDDLDQGFVVVLKANQEFLNKKNSSTDNRLYNECIKYYLG